MEFGTFLLLQSPSAETSETMYARGVEITQAAEELGFGNMWLAEHHFSTYGYLSRSHASFWFGDLGQRQVLRSMRLFAEEVMPAFR